ncbi:MAG: ROK family protein [Sedimentisphaerales bacterium]|nr:ROK family protein [Sedimentisphaerales bacterium]
MFYLGVDLGGTNIKAGIFSPECQLRDKSSAPCPQTDDPAEIVVAICDLSQQLLGDNNIPVKEVRAMGLGSPGPMNLKEGLVLKAPNIPALHNYPLGRKVSRRLGPPVLLENDANAACWGEFTQGAGKEVTEMVFLTLGTGIGGGVIANGKLVHGWKDEAGELGHMIIYPGGRLCGCGQKGCAEAYASASNIALRAMDIVRQDNQASSLRAVLEQHQTLTAKDVFDHAGQGDRLAQSVVDEATDVLGLLCVNVLHFSQPQRIVFSGGMIGAGAPLLEGIRRAFQRHIWTMKSETLEICFASLGSDAGLIGAAALAIDAYN